jgi:hypothetical protein
MIMFKTIAYNNNSNTSITRIFPHTNSISNSTVTHHACDKCKHIGQISISSDKYVILVIRHADDR